MTLRDLPPVNALAEVRITERYTLAHALTMMHGTIPGGYVRDRAIDVAVELNLLCDLTRPDSRDAVARLVAAKVGIECGATAPAFRFNEAMRMWFLKDAREHSLDVGFASTMEHTQPRDVRVPGISAITDPAEALARVAIVVLA